VTVLMMPLIVIALMFAVQVGLAYHARQVVAGAAQDGAAAGAMSGSSSSAGAATTRTLIEGAAGRLVEGLSVSGSQSGEVVTVSASARVVRVFPLFPTFRVSAASSASVEQFRPQGSP
jgi:Flp pilus assembly protein TadG